jgi:hypothetical protein
MYRGVVDLEERVSYVVSGVMLALEADLLADPLLVVLGPTWL